MYGLFKVSTVYWQCFCSPFVTKINVPLSVTISSLFVGVFSSNDLYLNQARDAATKKLIADHSPHAYLIPSSDHPHIIAGQGSIAVEFLEQVASFFIYLYTLLELNFAFFHREPTQSVCVADCYFIVNVLDLPFASPIAIYR